MPQSGHGIERQGQSQGQLNDSESGAKPEVLSVPHSHHRAQRARLLLRGQGLESGLGLEQGHFESKVSIKDDDGDIGNGLNVDGIKHDGNDEEGDDDEVGNNNYEDGALGKGEEEEDEDEEDESVPLWLQKLSDSSPLVRL